MTDRAANGTRLTADQFHQAPGVDGWRVLDNTACAWFDAPSLTAGANLVARIADVSDGSALPELDLRPGGLRVRLGGADGPGPTEADLRQAQVVSAAAGDLRLTADPSALQIIGLEFETANPAPVLDFWRVALAYDPSGADRLRDPLRRDPPISFRRLDQVATLRNRIHVDIVRPPEAVDSIRTTLGQEPFGVYGLTLADVEGNEADVVPGDPLGAAGEADDWRVIFSAMALYSAQSPGQAARFTAAVAALADNVGVPLLIDLRPGSVTIDSGKDLWEEGMQPAGTEFVDLARRIQSAAHDLELSAATARARFVQLGIDADDVPAARNFWASVLGYQPDGRTPVTDIYDPRRLNPVIIFQDLDSADEDRRRQRDRVHVVLWVPDDQVQARIDAAVTAGGQVVAEGTAGRCALSDPEGNELVFRWG